MQLTEKRKSPLTSIATAVLDPYAANFWLQKINPLWSVNQSLGKIVKKDTAAQGVVSFTLQFNKKFQIGAAGQHHPVYMTIQGVRYERTYSLTQLDAQHVLLTV
ncbi:ferredoxin reductase, partial [Acinetobacter sp. 207]